MIRKFVALLALLGGLLPSAAYAQAEAVANSGDTAWVLVASAFVLMMTIPGLGLFYGGLVRAKNVLSVVMHSFVICCAVSLLWVVCGYSLAFNGTADLLGGLDNFMFNNMQDFAPVTNATIHESVFALFQMTFAIITPALIIGAYVERIRFGWVVAFSVLWTLLVYVPVAHWVWGGGWLAKGGTLDFAGGIVVHTTAGIAALVLAYLLKARRGFEKTLLAPHSPTLTMVGAGLLWVGWFGFNGGSVLNASEDSAYAILNTHLAASAAALVWIGLEKWRIGKATSVGIVTGAVAGLATVTPAAGRFLVSSNNIVSNISIGPLGGILLGVIGATICFFAVQLIKQKAKIDDSLDVFAVHGVGGMTGSLLMPVFVLEALGGTGYDTAMTGVGFGKQLFAQLLGVGVVAAYTLIVTIICALMISFILPMRVDEEAEHDGLDISSHGEKGWDLD